MHYVIAIYGNSIPKTDVIPIVFIGNFSKSNNFWIAAFMKLFSTASIVRLLYVASILHHKRALYWENYLYNHCRSKTIEVKMGNLLFNAFTIPSALTLILTIILFVYSFLLDNSFIPHLPLLQTIPTYSQFGLVIAAYCLIYNCYFFWVYMTMHQHYCTTLHTDRK